MVNLIMKYADFPGKHARRAAELAARGEFVKSKKHASMAVQEQDILHPSLWEIWGECDADHFALCIDNINPKEIAKIQTARHAGRLDIAVCLGASSVKIAKLISKGLVIEKLLSNIGSAQLPSTYWLAFQGDVSRLLGLARAGVAPPDRLSLESAECLSKNRPPRTLLHVLASSRGMRWGVLSSDLDFLVDWALKGESIKTRNSEGQDALKVAIAHDNVDLALALTRAGADLIGLDSKSRSVEDLLSRKIKEYEKSRDYQMARIWERFASELFALKEKKIIDSAADIHQERSMRSISL